MKPFKLLHERDGSRLSRCLAALLLVACTLLLVAPAAAQLPSDDDAENFVDLMNNYLEFNDRWVEMAAKTRSAVHMAVEGIVELHVEGGEPDKAVEHLERIAKKFDDNRAVTTLIRFKLRDLYKEMGQTQRAMEQLELILEEHS